MDVRTGGRTFETHFIRSTWKSRPKNYRPTCYVCPNLSQMHPLSCSGCTIHVVIVTVICNVVLIKVNTCATCNSFVEGFSFGFVILVSRQSRDLSIEKLWGGPNLDLVLL